MSGSSTYCDWIAVDWGTSRLRAWAMKADKAIDAARSDQGGGGLAPEDYEPALLDVISPWLGQDRMQVVACGMVGARQGWIEAPYRSVPCAPVAEAQAIAPTRDPRLNVAIVSGLKQHAPADVLRGEETQIAGYLHAHPDFDGVICLPGTHTKWAQISAGEVVSFRTFMTGELFGLLSKQSVLRHSMGDGWDEAAFLEAVSDSLSKPEQTAGRLFSIRAQSLLTDRSPDAARARLSGLLIGIELAAARPYWLGQNIVVIGDYAIGGTYASALSEQGAAPQRATGDDVTLAGLCAAHAALMMET